MFDVSCRHRSEGLFEGVVELRHASELQPFTPHRVVPTPPTFSSINALNRMEPSSAGSGSGSGSGLGSGSVTVASGSERLHTPLDHLSPPPPPPPIDDPLVNGIKTLFDPTIKQTTEKLLQVHNSQLALSDELERLIARMSKSCSLQGGRMCLTPVELQNYLENSEPPAIRPTVVKLAATSKRLAAVNGELQMGTIYIFESSQWLMNILHYNSGFAKHPTTPEQVISTA